MNPFLLIQRSPIKRRRRKSKPGDDPEYLEWLRTLPCIVCLLKSAKGFTNAVINDLPTDQFLRHNFQKSSTEAAHVGLRGYGQKCPDRQAIPLCGIEHHREGPESHHKLGKRFWTHHGLDRDAIIRELNERYERECAA